MDLGILCTDTGAQNSKISVKAGSGVGKAAFELVPGQDAAVTGRNAYP
jgi:hypothetical protein